MTWGEPPQGGVPSDPGASPASSPPQAPPPPPGPPAPSWAPPAAAPTTGPPQALAGLSAITSVLLALSGLCAVLALVRELSLRSKTAALLHDGPAALTLARVASLQSAENRANSANRLVVISIIVAGVVFVIWFHRLVSNLSRTNRWHGGSLTMAAVGWFIPIANFIIPARYANDAWTATEPAAPAEADAASARAASGRTLLYSWWTLWCLQFLVRVIAGAIDPDSNNKTVSSFLHDYKTARGVFAVSFALLAVAAVTAILVVQQLSRRAEALSAG